MAVTHNPAGFTGTVDQIDEARRLGIAGGGRFRVDTSADWAITADGAVNRTVNIAAGSAAACGVLDVTTAVEALVFGANAGGTDRLDAVVASFDWSTMTVSFRVVAGTTVPPVIVRTGTTVDLNKINWLPGTRYDAVLGIVRARPGVTILAPADLYDCRPWGSWDALNVATALFRDQIDVDPGGVIADSGGIAWQKQRDGSWLAPKASGKMWRTSGISGVPATPGAGGSRVVMDNARVTGGVTFDNTADTLVLPCDGFWRVTGKGWSTGGSGYETNYIVRRTRSAAVGVVAASGFVYKASTVDVSPKTHDVMPLLAGDALALWAEHTLAQGGYYGINEISGVCLTVEYVGPLNGATPV